MASSERFPFIKISNEEVLYSGSHKIRLSQWTLSNKNKLVFNYISKCSSITVYLVTPSFPRHFEWFTSTSLFENVISWENENLFSNSKPNLCRFTSLDAKLSLITPPFSLNTKPLFILRSFATLTRPVTISYVTLSNVLLGRLPRRKISHIYWLSIFSPAKGVLFRKQARSEWTLLNDFVITFYSVKMLDSL